MWKKVTGGIQSSSEQRTLLYLQQIAGCMLGYTAWGDIVD